MSFNQELQEDLINSSILRSAFFNYFFRVFKAKYQITPLQYRKQFQ